MIGKTLSHYKVIEKIGQGGMGEVYRATDTKLNRDVALKILPEQFASDSQRMGRFQREAEVLASLDHPNIGQIYGIEEAGQTKALVLQLIEGPTLAEKIAQGPIPIEEALKIALQITEGVEAAHEKGVIHRDLKPANIKITPEGQVKILDFGLAKALEGEMPASDLSQSPTLTQAATLAGVILGTAAYMSPEQARGKPVDKRTDIWAFGAVLFEMLTGRRTFEGEDVADTLASVLKSDPQWKALSAETPAVIRRLLERCLMRDEQRRLRDIGEARIAIQEYLADPKAAMLQPVAEVVQAAPRPILPWVLAAVVLTALTAGVAVWKLKPTPQPAAARFYHELPDGQAFSRSGRPLVAVSPDGSQIAYVANLQLYLRNLGEMAARPIEGTDENPNNPFFSPDGDWIGYWSFSESQLKKIAPIGGAPVTLSDAKEPFGVSWGSDDILMYGQPEGIMRVSANGGTPELVVPTEQGEQVHGPQMLPGGEWVLFTLTSASGVTRWDEAQIVVQSLDSGERKILWEGGSDARYVPTGHLVYALEDVLFALPFDLASLEVSGGPVPVVEGVRRAFAPQGQTASANYGFSDSGTLIYVPGSGSGGSVLALADRSGGLETLDVPPMDYVSPRLSPDGTRLVVEASSDEGIDIWVYELGRDTQIRRLTLEGNNIRPIWAPDGERVTFASDREEKPGIYWQAADGSGLPERLTTAEEGTQHWPESWSPDGKTLSFAVVSGDDAAVWTLSRDSGTEPDVFVDESGSIIRGSAFSPDGKWLAYHSNESAGGRPGGTGTFEVYVQPFPKTGAKYRITQQGGVVPLWSPDGTEFFYLSLTSNQLMGIDITTDAAFAFGNERVVFGMHGIFTAGPGIRSYDITPDGQRFLMILPQGEPDSAASAQRINVVQNWFEELKERVPVP